MGERGLSRVKPSSVTSSSSQVSGCQPGAASYLTHVTYPCPDDVEMTYTMYKTVADKIVYLLYVMCVKVIRPYGESILNSKVLFLFFLHHLLKDTL